MSKNSPATPMHAAPGSAPASSTDHLDSFVESSLNSDDFKILPLAGDASSRKYYRVVSSDQSWALMEWEPFDDDGRYPFLNVLEHFDKANIHVPEVIKKAPDKGLVLLEDLGDLTLERKFWENQDQLQALPFYKQAIDELLKIHYVANDTVDKSCVAFDIEFDVEKFMWEMNYAKKHLIEGVAEVKLSKSTADQLNDDFEKICKLLHRQPKRISHRDYHSRNLMLKLDRMRVIDFQDARMGPIQYDLVSLVHDSYVDMNGNMQGEVLGYYHARAKQDFNQNYSMDEFNEVFLVQLIQRCFKACGSFSSFMNMRSDKRYLHYIQPTLKKVKDTLDLVGEFRTLRDIIEDEGLLEINYEEL